MGFLDTSAFRRFAADKMQKVNLFETPQMFCDVYCLEPGQAQKVHAHSGATKFYYVIEGEGTFTVGDATRTLRPGQLAWSVPDEAHGVENRSIFRVLAAGDPLRASCAPCPMPSPVSTEPDYNGDIGIDVKYGVTPSLTLDVTYNTDFAQVEVDEQVINLPRFNVRFPPCPGKPRRVRFSPLAGSPTGLLLRTRDA